MTTIKIYLSTWVKYHLNLISCDFNAKKTLKQLTFGLSLSESSDKHGLIAATGTEKKQTLVE